MTGIFGAVKPNPQIPPERCCFPSLCQSFLPPPTLAAGTVLTTAVPHKSLASAPCRGQHLTSVCEYVCVCVHAFYFKLAPSILTRWTQKQNAGGSQRDTPCGNCISAATADWSIRANSKHVLRASVLMQTRPPVILFWIACAALHSNTDTHTMCCSFVCQRPAARLIL